jgi:hypothetical protein
MTAAYFIGSHWGVMGFAWSWVGGMAVLTTATVTLSGRIIGLQPGGLAKAVLPPLAAALAMAGGVWLALRGMPPVPNWVALGIAVPLGVALYLGALNIIAPDRLAEALNFARNRNAGEPEPAPAE